MASLILRVKGETLDVKQKTADAETPLNSGQPSSIRHFIFYASRFTSHLLRFMCNGGKDA